MVGMGGMEGRDGRDGWKGWKGWMEGWNNGRRSVGKRGGHTYCLHSNRVHRGDQRKEMAAYVEESDTKKGTGMKRRGEEDGRWKKREEGKKGEGKGG
jgi:hypothetical protein